MARYLARVRTSMSAGDAFDYLSDLRNFALWDPSVVRSLQVEGDGPGPEAIFDVTVRHAGTQTTLRYRVTDYVPPQRMTVVGRTQWVTSTDTVRASAVGEGSEVVYDAALELRWPLSVFDPVLQAFFNRFGDQAAAGLAKALRGTLT